MRKTTSARSLHAAKATAAAATNLIPQTKNVPRDGNGIQHEWHGTHWFGIERVLIV